MNRAIVIGVTAALVVYTAGLALCWRWMQAAGNRAPAPTAPAAPVVVIAPTAAPAPTPGPPDAPAPATQQQKDDAFVGGFSFAHAWFAFDACWRDLLAAKRCSVDTREIRSLVLPAIDHEASLFSDWLRTSNEADYQRPIVQMSLVGLLSSVRFFALTRKSGDWTRAADSDANFLYIEAMLPLLAARVHTGTQVYNQPYSELDYPWQEGFQFGSAWAALASVRHLALMQQCHLLQDNQRSVVYAEILSRLDPERIRTLRSALDADYLLSGALADIPEVKAAFGIFLEFRSRLPPPFRYDPAQLLQENTSFAAIAARLSSLAEFAPHPQPAQ